MPYRLANAVGPNHFTVPYRLANAVGLNQFSVPYRLAGSDTYLHPVVLEDAQDVPQDMLVLR